VHSRYTDTIPLTILLIDTEENRARAAALQADGLITAAQVGVRLKAGSNCGSCIPELQKPVQTVPSLSAAE
jgi:hypothetical protein